MSLFKLTYKSFGDRAILVEWPKEINTVILEDIINLKNKIERMIIELIVEIRISFNSLLIIYNKIFVSLEREIANIDKIYCLNASPQKTNKVLWKIPVCYDDRFGLDLGVISKQKKMSKPDIINLHSQTSYTVYFIGFLPGFIYLGGLDEALNIPRKSSPRLSVKKGSIAIGGNQTGVYPNSSPGGWNIIGNSPINFFDVSKEIPCFAKAGDVIQFYPISVKEHQDIKTLVNANVYQIKSQVIND